MFFEGKAYYFVGKDGWNEAANGATKKRFDRCKTMKTGGSDQAKFECMFTKNWDKQSELL